MTKGKKEISTDQLAFNFDFDNEFNKTLGTISRLEQYTNEENHDIRTATISNSISSAETRNNDGDPSITIIQPTRLENFGSLGSQQPREAENVGTARRSSIVREVIRPTNTGEQRFEQSPSNEWDGRTRNIDDGRGIDGALKTIAPVNYIITDSDELGKGGARSKYKDNINAIRQLKTLQESNKQATHEDKTALVKYVGWGGLPQVFDHRNEDWQVERTELASLLTNSEYINGRRSTQDAHYTPEIVIKNIYTGLDRMGFIGGKILEPSAGIGHFIGLAPEKIRTNSQFTAIELDPISSAIAKQLYPLATHINKPFQEITIPSGYYDAVVGNPPFGNQSLHDLNHKDLAEFSIHNYFIAKSLDKLRERGVMAIVVSRFFLDSTQSAAREHIAEKAHFLGAIRLPNNTFKQNALTQVTTDVVFFQKAVSDEVIDKSWLSVGEIRDPETGNPIVINQYYIDNPDQMIGQMSLVSGPFKPMPELVAKPGINLDKEIEHRLQVLPINNYHSRSESKVETVKDVNKPILTLPDELKIGAFFITPNGRVARRLPDLLDQHDYIYPELKNEKTAERIIGMIGIRQSLRELMQAEQSESSTTSELDSKRASLNDIYDKYVKKYGYISSQSNRLSMSDDPEYPLLHALESNYDRGVSKEMAKKNNTDYRAPSVKKADIFFKRVIQPKRVITSVETAKEALVVSMNESGRVDMSHMVRLTNKREEDIVRELKGLIYLNPESEQWETIDKYLSGNVKHKLIKAELSAKTNENYIDNINALKKIQPVDIDAVDISIQLGSSWVPEDIIKQFVAKTLGDVHQNITYQPSLGKWLVKIGSGDKTTMTSTWGTEAYPANELIISILENKAIQVKKIIGVDSKGGNVYEIDDTQTAAANQKAEEIKQSFLDWVWEDKNRRDVLSRLYNDKFNTHVTPIYDGSHLTLPGSSVNIKLRTHQKDAIWRGIQEGGVLYDHVVGAGKTLVCVGTVMESKRMGLVSKPMLVVPNHLLLQWKDEFYSLYPNANILVTDKNDFKKENREKLFSRIATGDWDAVIVAHSSFKKIGMPPNTLKQLLNEQVNDLSSAISKLKQNRGDRVTIKDMEKARERMLEKMKKKADTGDKDQSITFDQLGVDALIVDEAHEFKNLFITTSYNRVSGLGNLTGSDKAFDMFVKARYIQEKNDGKGVFFATGTPISNTIAELYTMHRYMRYAQMKELDIVHFDAWASTFGQVVSGWELDATGVNYKLNSRFSKFQNVPELISLYQNFADVITKQDLEQQAEASGTKFPIPKVKGGKPHNIIVERSLAQENYMGRQVNVHDDNGQLILKADGNPIRQWNEGSIIYRMENLPEDPRIDNPLKITNDARKVGLDYRLINPDADDFDGSKVNAAVEQIYRIYQKWNDDKGTQLVFCDLSTPKGLKHTVIKSDDNISSESESENTTESTIISMDELLATNTKFSVYDDIKAKLIVKGVPSHEIKFIHEATTDIQKQKLFTDVNNGTVRVLLGSTSKMGAGTNVQKRLVGLHHLDAPWRPSDLEQRDGRILRQGNQLYQQNPDGFEVELIRYATKQTYDSRMWQTIEFKASSIEQFRKGDSLTRTIDDVAGEAANAAEMKAAATGNPLIFMQVKITADLKKLEAIYSNYKRNQHSLDNRIAWLSKAESRVNGHRQKWLDEIYIRDSNSTDKLVFNIAGTQYTEKNREALHKCIMDSIKDAIKKRAEGQKIGVDAAINVPIGTYRGFNISVTTVKDGLEFCLFGKEFYKPGNLFYRGGDSFSLTGFISRLDNFLNSFEDNIKDIENIFKKESAEYHNAIFEKNKPFSQLPLLNAMRKDMRDIIAELTIMQSNDTYVSTWKPSHTKLLDTIEKQPLKRLSL